MTAIRRRTALAALGSGLLAAGCARDGTAHIEGGFTGTHPERGHLLREPWVERPPDVTRRVHTLIAGGGIAGLAAARALRLAGRDDFALLELEDSAGGNSRGTQVGGMDCPLGAHYLPVPGDDAPEVQDFLEELGLRRRVAGRWTYDERHLCHSPQERLFFNGEWQDGLLPVQGIGAATRAQYQRFAHAIAAAQQEAHYRIPVSKFPFVQAQWALDAINFKVWLTQQQLTDEALLWYLDYCCRDDFGAGIDAVSAWAGVHYFASRHGFHAPHEPGDSAARADDADTLTWPQGNGWLSARLAAPCAERLHTGRVVRRIEHGRHGVTVDALDVATGRAERWQAAQCIVALPLFAAARVLAPPPAAVTDLAARLTHAPWLVANLRLRGPLHDRPGAAPSWDNVIYGSAGLGYVDAMHQSLRAVPGATVLTYYRALGIDPAARAALLQRPWAAWRDEILADLSVAHPDLAAQTVRLEIVRHGHAMAVPRPEIMNQIGRMSTSLLTNSLYKTEQIQPIRFAGHERLWFAHSDWSGYSVFEEAFTHGHAAGRGAALT